MQLSRAQGSLESARTAERRRGLDLWYGKSPGPNHLCDLQWKQGDQSQRVLGGLGRRGSRAATGAVGEGNEPPWLWGVEISHTEGPVLLNFALDGIDNPAGRIHFERLGGSARSPP